MVYLVKFEAPHNAIVIFAFRKSLSLLFEAMGSRGGSFGLKIFLICSSLLVIQKHQYFWFIFVLFCLPLSPLISTKSAISTSIYNQTLDKLAVMLFFKRKQENPLDLRI